ncbi:hypothetical protein AB0F17_58400 [Nonomuraea sp. NPDC026600]|uniref:hypothetical protein n=1 Tax=Nonomuraea sp. NPDC026600 TaxID=3155363 RepID=UPI00340C0A6B
MSYAHSDKGRTVLGAIGVNVLGIVSSPSLPKAKLNELLSSFGGGRGEDKHAKAEARREIAKLSDDAWVTAVVELSEPLVESKLNSVVQVSSIGSDAVYPFLSGWKAQANSPIYWRPCAIYAEKCEATPPLQLYRQWVSRLRWLDAPNLKRLNLDIDTLRRAADEGRVYGFLTYGYPKTGWPKYWRILRYAR